MKKLFLLSVLFLLVFNVSAQEEGTASPSPLQLEEEDVGITPDSPLYGLENALKRLSLAFTFNQEKKAEKEIRYARERLREVRLMVEQKKVDAAEKAMINRERLMEKLRERIEKGEDIKTNIDLEVEVEDQEEELEEISTKLEVNGLSEAQKKRVKNMIAKMKVKNQRVREKVQERQEKLKEKSEVLREKIEEMKEKGLERSLKIRIEHVRREIEKSNVLVIIRERKEDLMLAEDKLKEAERKIEEKKYEEAKGLINEASKLTVLVRGQGERLEKVKEIIRNRKEIKDDLKERLEKAKEVLKEKNLLEKASLKERELLGKGCGTVSPDSRDECCNRKGYNSWDMEGFECEKDDDEGEVKK